VKAVRWLLALAVSYYGMDGQKISREEGITLFEADDGRRVARDEIGDVEVSTVLLVFDTAFYRERPGETHRPIIFETMIFGGEHDQEQWRYATKEEALEGHRRAVALVEGKEGR